MKKNICLCFKQISKGYTCFYNHFSKEFQIFRYVALVTKKVMHYLRFFFDRPGFFPPCTEPYALKIFFYKNPLNYFSLKITKFHSDSVKNESTRTKKAPPCLFRVKQHGLT